MKYSLSAALFLALGHAAVSQKSPIKFGDIPMEDMKMTVYKPDSSAAAVILVDYGVATGGKSRLILERHVRIKILKKGGMGWADVIIPLISPARSGTAQEKILDLKASTYNLEGDKIVETEMSKEGIFKENFNRAINLQKFTLANVKEGSVLEYFYKVSTPNVIAFPNWEFQKRIPIRWSEFWAIIPEFFTFERYIQGYVASDYEAKDVAIDTESPGYMAKAQHWISRDVPAFYPEPFMTCETDYVSKIIFALKSFSYRGEFREIMGSWASLNTQSLEKFGETINKSSFLKEPTEKLVAGITDPMKKIEAIHLYVRQNIEWDGVKAIHDSNLKKVLETKKGNASDVNLLLAAMLDKAGLTVEMVMLSTRDHGFVRKDYPMSRQFNYVICAVRVDGKPVLLDATEKFLPVNVLPERCLNGQGLLISKIAPGWIDIVSKAKAKTIVHTELALESGGELRGKLNFIRDGYDANATRKEYNSKGQETYIKDFFGTKTWQIGSSEFQNVNESDKPLIENHEVVISEQTSVAGNVIYVNPFVENRLKENPFRPETRKYPVDFGNRIEKMYVCKIDLPVGFAVDELPKSVVLMTPGNGARYTLNVVQVGNAVSITSNLQINQSLFVQDEYPYLREFYNQVVAKQAEQIVLKKN